METGAGSAAPAGGDQRPDLPKDHAHHDQDQSEIAAEQPSDDVGSGLDRRKAGKDRIGGEPGQDRQTHDDNADDAGQPGKARMMLGLDVRQRHDLPGALEALWQGINNYRGKFATVGPRRKAILKAIYVNSMS